MFHSESPSEVRTALGSVLAEHDLVLGQGKIDTILFQRRLNEISVMTLAYGAEVQVNGSPLNGFSLVQTPSRGSFEVEIVDPRAAFGQGDVAV